MTLIYPEGGDEARSSEKMFSEAFEIFERAGDALRELVKSMEAGDFSEVASTKKIVSTLEEAAHGTLKARLKLDDHRKRQSGIARGDFAIDFEAARTEIGRRLACLRERGGEGGVSG